LNCASKPRSEPPEQTAERLRVTATLDAATKTADAACMSLAQSR
jgi:hypothetical protein